MKTKLVDKRYTIGLEACGKSEQKHITRFCGDWVGESDTRGAAEVKAVQHAVEPGHKSKDWKLLTSHGNALLLECNGTFRSVRNEIISEFASLLDAWIAYSCALSDELRHGGE